MSNAYLYVLDTVADWEYGLLAAELNTGRFFAHPGMSVPVRTVSRDGGPVTSMGGVRIHSDLALGDLTPTDAAVLILPGGQTWAANTAAVAKATEFLAAGVPVAAICGATNALADAGLLDDRPHTSNDLGALEAGSPAYRGADHYVQAPTVTDGDLITANGTAQLDFAKAVLARLGVMSPAALEAWFQLYRTGEARHFYALTNALPQFV